MKNLVVLGLVLWSGLARAQHAHSVEEGLKFRAVLQQSLSDSLKNYALESSTLEVAPGFRDTRPHRHDADLFGYVLQGEVLVGLEGKEGKRYKAGEMFFEPRMVLHSLLENPHKTEPARILLVFVIGQGKQHFIPESK
ncbi:cupin domain-containing protein [Larkinella soli]|uniref:cupin domain-containing protein n=1 Tax=Larkinella soli TaxID=1770527 RepID=UPI000FFBF20D|nr:cupin domain-containing protein [Larkinella soli]